MSPLLHLRLVKVGLVDSFCFVTESSIMPNYSRIISLRTLLMDPSSSIGNLESEERFLCALWTWLLNMTLGFFNITMH